MACSIDEAGERHFDQTWERSIPKLPKLRIHRRYVSPPHQQAACGPMPPKKSAGFGLANPRGARKSAGNPRSLQEAAAAAPAADRPGTAVGDDESKFLVEAADRALAGAGYRVGAAVEYNSATLGGWAAATVTKVWAGGTVDVQTDEMAWGRYRGTRCAENLAPLGAGAKVLRLAGSGDATTPLVPSAEPEEMYRKRMNGEAQRACRSTAAQAIDAAAAAPCWAIVRLGNDWRLS